MIDGKCCETSVDDEEMRRTMDRYVCVFLITRYHSSKF